MNDFLRIKGRTARKQKTGREEASEKICMFLNEYIQDKTVMSYMPIDCEADVSVIRAKIFPVIDERDRIIPVQALNGFKKGKYGIFEPVGEEYTGKIDVVIVPMCAFDKNMNRLGFGKGYYDEFLADFKGTKIGVAFACQEVNGINARAQDVKMDIIITENGVLK